MAFCDFTFASLKKFPLSITSNNHLFTDVQQIAAEDWLVRMLERSVIRAQAIGTEKARSEFIIAPILLEAQVLVGESKIALFSGTEFIVDEEQGLNGRCDYLFSRSANSFQIEAPIVAVVEATTDNINAALPQCIAEMLASHLFNEREERSIPHIYGIVTTGSLWRFLRLSYADAVFSVEVEERDRSVTYLEELLGIIVHLLRSSHL